MPELPEVETLRRQLADTVIGETIRGLVFIDEKIKPFRIAEGVAISDVRRWGKYLGICLSNNKQIIIHLRMSGRLFLSDSVATMPPHSRFVIALKNNRIICSDPRRFATVELFSSFSKPSLIENPLEHFDIESVMDVASSRLLPIKQFLLEQGIIAGIGNIYACEILFSSQISPFRKTCAITLREWGKIAKSSKKILQAGVKCRGTSISDWRDLFDKKGTYQERLLVYGRKGEGCPKCGSAIEREKLGGRGTYFCATCQK